ncbi:MAG: septal ring lytic transglycosylase RlpA family protein [Gammaproteobacteria bacterium]|nr:MAG: septal ring lytic transglycosylase RlpA family protein [Gammaproteobacteria bacterium]
MVRCLALAFFFSLTLTASGETPTDVQEGDASYYADSLHGNATASGEPYNKSAMTAAHRELPLGTKVRVTYRRTGRSVLVTINDRGPHAEDRFIEVSGAAARELGMVEDGHGRVTVEVISD